MKLLPEAHCPYCGYKMDAASSLAMEDAGPEPDDYTICLKCGGFMIFDENMRLLKASLNVARRELPPHVFGLLVQARAAIRNNEFDD